MQSWRLGIDLGASSLGWCAIALDETGQPSKILAAGSRIFSDGRDPQSKESLATDRRVARAMRRRRDRLLQRKAALLRHLAAAGLLPEGESARALVRLDPWDLRARALDEALPLHHVGRALFHINQRRGFKSNRKTDRTDEKEAGKISMGTTRLRAAMLDAGARTLGEFLNGRRAAASDRNHVPSVRARLRPETGEDAKGTGYDFYPDRALLEEEFRTIFEAQMVHHPDDLTPDVFRRLFEVVFHQRPLKVPEVGVCMLVSGERRLAKAHPLFQRRRLLETVNGLRILRPGQVGASLTLEQRDLVLAHARQKAKVTFDQLRKVLKLDPDARFSIESDNRPALIGDEIADLMAKKTRFGAAWARLTWQEQWSVIAAVMDEEDEDKLIADLCARWGLPAEAARAVALTGGRLPKGYGRFGQTASLLLIEAMEADVVVYSEAVQRAGLGHHSDFRTGEVHDELPYYGAVLEQHIMPGTGRPEDDEEVRIGRITNPTVHIGLNQLRRVVNRLIRAHGKPAEIALELARELKMTEEQKDRINRENAGNRRAAEARAARLREIGQPDSGANRALLRLWEELCPSDPLDRRCPYSGQQISIAMLFDGSVEVDHILPFEATLDDGNGNKTLCLREANRLKRKRSPHEARHDFAGRFGEAGSWEMIAARAAKMPREKRWRFAPDAMERFAKDGGFLARLLVDTQYLSRMARTYLSTLYAEAGEGSSHVWVSPGRLTEMVRRKLGLNDLLPDHNIGSGADQPKNRLDHRHHAIDAAVVAIVDRGMIAAIARASGREGEAGRERIIVPDPWPGFRDDLGTVLRRMVVSHRPDKGTAAKAGLAKGRDSTAGRLHNDTAYGLTGQTDARGNSLVVRRKPLTALKPEDLEDNPYKGVRDPDLRAALRAATEGLEGKDFEAALQRFPATAPAAFRGVRRVRVIEPLTVIAIADRQGRPYKGYKGDANYRYDVWELKDGKWQAEVVSMFDAHQPGWQSRIRAAHPTARKVLSLSQNDIVAIEPTPGERQLMRVVKFTRSFTLALSPPNEAGNLKARDALSQDLDPFKYWYLSPGSLKSSKARQVRIDELGRVLDPGFPARKSRRTTRPRPSP